MLQVVDGFAANDSPLTETLCGAPPNQPLTFTSSTNMMRVRFYSDSSIGSRGFTLTYTAVDGQYGLSVHPLSVPPVTVGDSLVPLQLSVVEC